MPLTIYASANETHNSLGASSEDDVKDNNAEPEYIETVEIDDSAALIAFSQRVNGGDSMKDVQVLLTDHVVLEAQPAWVPVGNTLETPFRGTFDGQGFSITGITVEDEVVGGLFGYLEGATIQNVVLKNVQAPNSVGGLYFIAIRSTITDCSRRWGLFGMFARGISLFSLPPDEWDGSTDTTLNVSGAIIEIDSAKQLKQVQLLNAGGNTFDGKTLILTRDLNMMNIGWAAIGTSTDRFKGNFYGGGSTISNLSVSSGGGGLFNYIEGGAISNLIIDRATIASSNTGVLAASSDSTISGIVVMNSSINGTGSNAGIVSSQSTSSTTDSHPISQCVVMKTTISGTTVAGIVATNRNYAVTQCAVYDCTINGSTSSSGITDSSSGPSGTYSGINQHIVMGVTFGNSPSGVIKTISSWNSSGNCFITDVSMTNSSTVYLGTGSVPYGVDYFFTDSRLTNPLVNHNATPGHNANKYISNCYWDTSTVNGVRTGQTNMQSYGRDHGFYKTSYLTNGGWTPNDTFWEAKKDHYPYLKYTMNSDTPYLREITGLAAVAVLLDNPEESLSGAKEFRLMKNTAAGDPIIWTTSGGSGGSIQKRETEDQTAEILYTKDNAGVNNFNLKATITLSDGTTMEKNFENLTLLDSYLNEDTSGRYPATNQVIDNTDVPRLLFNDPVDVNTSARGAIRLFAERSDGADDSLEAVRNCDSTNMVITVVGGQYQVEFPTFHFIDGYKYRLLIPAGALEEIDPPSTRKANYSDEIELSFSISSTDMPAIELIEPQYEFLAGDTLTHNQVKEWFLVYLKSGGAVWHNTSNQNPTIADVAQLLTTPVTNPVETLDSLTTAGVYYYVDPAIIGNPLQPGTSTVHVFAVNALGAGVRRAITVEISGLPSWDTEPPELLHTYWTEDITAVQAAVMNSAAASYQTARGGRRSAALEVEINVADWAKAQTPQHGPTAVKVTTYMLDKEKNRVVADARETTVYLDRALKYAFNTAPLRYTWQEDRTLDEWKELIEEDIAFAALNFAPTANVRFDHGTNNYSKDGIYEVHLKTAVQTVTVCDANSPCSADNHAHLKDRVELTFTIKIVGAQDPDERIFWEKVEDEILQSEFNDTVVRRPRLSYTDHLDGEEFTSNFFEMPAQIIEALRLQPYNTLELHYSAYRWKFYGHALEQLPARQKLYPLKAYQDDEQTLVRRVIGKKEPAVQVRFDYVGLLNGRVEFFYDLRLAGGLTREEIENTNFYLYKYVRTTGKLVPVSDVIVDEDGWASAVLTKLENEVYVFADEKFGGREYERYIGYTSSQDNEPSGMTRSRYYQSNKKLDLEMFESDSAAEVEAFAYPYTQETTALIEEMDQAMYGEPSTKTVRFPAAHALVVGGLACVLLAGAAIVILKIRGRKGV